jgi:BirA family transcriptional regulator, biotin operon repressor / biotin---[acetyl-CoA-carboxylase] ligase
VFEPIPGVPGYRHHQRGETGSTNADALAAARMGDPGRLWITASRQMAGKGRQGRVWVSEPGNLYASLLLIDPARDVTALGTLPLAVACGVHATLAALTGMARRDLKIKWPNDILVDGKKICGILLESATPDHGHLAVAIGIGINIAHHPDPALYQATDLTQLGIVISPHDLFPHLASAMAATLEAWNHGRGFPQIRAEWLRLAKGQGDMITVNLPNGPVQGRFDDIDAEGRLVLTLQNGQTRSISAGDVFFAAPSKLSGTP